ncbi:DUF3794 and LysM peptidoglycan-binding domain-containing protein [Serpentinicella alkaliphila]|uniref:LysM domain-containing protein n=1 Tax=Serpentinicella alkaliphila TaxID=1734049 RepID=A0A4R2U3Y6_9FIRM|nr:SPOCS domain-containing protein [Serpentinicella alkaliphila]QUH25330.1 DUF3794 domain-containing protein [Serpentinicella alkaliphila]TCQ02383.1 LysM domain-containing protein [Serpentinicella alkaliphila]
MPVELVKDMFKAEQLLGENMAQAIVEGDIIVPDSKPDITRILTVDGSIFVNKKEAKDNNLAVEGTIYFKILYASDKGDDPLYNMDSATEFKQTIEIPGLTSKMESDVAVEIEHVDYSINNDRKIGVKAVINILARGIEEKDIEIAKDVDGVEDVELLKNTIKYSTVVGSNSSNTLIKDAFELDEDMDPIKEILNWNGKAIAREVKVAEGKVIAAGTLFIELLYIADDEEYTLNVLKKEIPFTHFIEIPKANTDMQCAINMSLEELSTELKENVQGVRKILEFEGIVKLQAKVKDILEKEFLVDAYSPTKFLKVEKTKLSYNEAVGVNKTQMQFRDTLQVPKTNPPVIKVLSVQTKPILTDYNLLGSKVNVEGILEAVVLYTAEDNFQPIYSFTQELPFKYAIDMDNVDSDASAEVSLIVQEAESTLINGQQVDLKVNILITCDCYTSKSVEVVSGVEELDEIKNLSQKPSLTIYFYQKGDSLWKVAKRYNTTVKQLMETNNIDSPEDVKAGDHLIIEKTYSFKF